ncbi:hypothetical protein FEDK69T_24480 [Flavobacterium enshiense DK69]|uniref:Uncharacterized protein n=1 Tax=Flavobacterium enshiense DK69 TaxID=1107311 RepID=V6S7Q9_9FLAO|nr:hypothetical protein [Flavobacterium enshiense]ESU22454.1 hypothetical protein FEDK69T_24480 [Flavobacterium enshiense DK69]KGO97458.1 hypothetical protein Q767_02365 [Flavobacterium enshiense DK69]
MVIPDESSGFFFGATRAIANWRSNGLDASVIPVPAVRFIFCSVKTPPKDTAPIRAKGQTILLFVMFLMIFHRVLTMKSSR